MHILVILIVLVLLFGPQKLPEIGKALGESIKEFKKAAKSISSDDEKMSDPY